eukprot:COSAG02_NODE_8079_length_2719_cov_10.868701_1_plen_805_part_10
MPILGGYCVLRAAVSHKSTQAPASDISAEFDSMTRARYGVPRAADATAGATTQRAGEEGKNPFQRRRDGEMEGSGTTLSSGDVVETTKDLAKPILVPKGSRGRIIEIVPGFFGQPPAARVKLLLDGSLTSVDTRNLMLVSEDKPMPVGEVGPKRGASLGSGGSQELAAARCPTAREPEPETQQDGSGGARPEYEGGGGGGGTPRSRPDEARTDEATLVGTLCTHLMEEVGISYRKAVVAYATRLFEEGYDSPAAFSTVPLEDLAGDHAWKAGHVAQVKLWRDKKAPAVASAPTAYSIAVALRAPPSVVLAAGSDGDPFAADRAFFRPRNEVAPVADIDAHCGADNLNQGSSGTCVRYGVAAAITDNVNARVESSGLLVDFAQAKLDRSCQQGIADALLQLLPHADGCSPYDFDAKSLNIRDAKGRLYGVQISVTMNTTMNQRALDGENLIDPSRQRKTHVICYEAAGVHAGVTHGRHCIYLEDCDIASCEWLGLNSWGDSDQRPQISMHSKVSIYDVVATRIEVLQGSSITDASSGRSKKLTQNIVLHPPWVRDAFAKVDGRVGVVNSLREGQSFGSKQVQLLWGDISTSDWMDAALSGVDAAGRKEWLLSIAKTINLGNLGENTCWPTASHSVDDFDAFFQAWKLVLTHWHLHEDVQNVLLGKRAMLYMARVDGLYTQSITRHSELRHAGLARSMGQFLHASYLLANDDLWKGKPWSCIQESWLERGAFAESGSRVGVVYQLRGDLGEQQLQLLWSDLSTSEWMDPTLCSHTFMLADEDTEAWLSHAATGLSSIAPEQPPSDPI